MKTRFNIKARLAQLGKTSRDVIFEINDRGVGCSPSSFSVAINIGKAPKDKQICELADSIISEWEKNANKA